MPLIPRRNFKKPKLPERFAIIDAEGYDDGPFNRSDLVQSTLPGKPWGIVNGGSPLVFRVLKQKGDKIQTADSGEITIVELPSFAELDYLEAE